MWINEIQKWIKHTSVYFHLPLEMQIFFLKKNEIDVLITTNTILISTSQKLCMNATMKLQNK